MNESEIQNISEENQALKNKAIFLDRDGTINHDG
jgi:histidinol phosphatase-like enzyme